MADPDRLGTLLPLLAGVTVVCWLMGSADGDDVTPLHGDRLESLLAKLVDSGVRGLVYEAAAAWTPRCWRRGRSGARRGDGEQHAGGRDRRRARRPRRLAPRRGRRGRARAGRLVLELGHGVGGAGEALLHERVSQVLDQAR